MLWLTYPPNLSLYLQPFQRHFNLTGSKILILVTLLWPQPHPFQEQFLADWDMLWLTYWPNLKSLASPVMEIWKALKMHEIGWLKVISNVTIRTHVISYLSLTENMCLSCTICEIRWVICRNSSTSTYPTCIWHPRWGRPRSNFEKIFGVTKLESLGYHAALFATSYIWPFL